MLSLNFVIEWTHEINSIYECYITNILFLEPLGRGQYKKKTEKDANLQPMCLTSTMYNYCVERLLLTSQMVLDFILNDFILNLNHL